MSKFLHVFLLLSIMLFSNNLITAQNVVFTEDWETGIDGWINTVSAVDDGTGTNMIGVVTGTNKPHYSFTALENVDQIILEAEYASDLAATFDHIDLRSEDGLYLRIATNGSNQFEIKDGANTNPITATDVTLEADQWYQLKLTYTPATNHVVLYVDGVEKANFTSVQVATSTFNRIDITQYVDHTTSVDNISLSYTSPSDITAFVLSDQTEDALINLADTSISIEVVYGTTLTALAPNITLSENCTVIPNTGVAQDFTSAVNYTVTHSDGSTKTWEVTVTEASAESSDAEITSFSIPDQIGTTVINAADTTIRVEMTSGTNVTALVPTIEISEAAGISPASGMAQDFTGEFDYTVTAEDGSIKVWTVSVTTVEPMEVNFFDGFEDGNVDGWDISTDNIAVTVVDDTVTDSKVAELTPIASKANGFGTYFENATQYGKPWMIAFDYKLEAIASWPHIEINTWPNRLRISPDVNNLSYLRYLLEPNGTIKSSTPLQANRWYNFKILVDPEIKTYRLFVDDVVIFNDTVANANLLDSAGYFGHSIYGTETKAYLDNVKSCFFRDNATEILNAFMPGQAALTDIDESTKTITLTVPYSMDITDIAPELTANPGASISPDPTVGRDFTSAQSYTITSKDGSRSTSWTVRFEKHLNTEANILSFFLAEQTGFPTISEEDSTVVIEVEHGTDVTALTPIISISPEASINPSSNVTQDFSAPVTYLVTAANGNEMPWEVTVNVALSSENDITDFSISGQAGSAVINSGAATIDVTMPEGTDLSALTPAITISDGAGISPESGIATDFTGTVTYTVTAEDGSMQDWTVNVVTGVSGIANTLNTIDVNYYPNPVSNKLYIETNTTINVELRDLNGKLILSENNFHGGQLDVSQYASGEYLLILTDVQNSARRTEAIIIE